MNSVIRLLINIFIGSASMYGVITGILYIVGVYFMLKQSGSKPYYAFIPAYREYALAECADCELEGRTLWTINMLVIVLNVVAFFVNHATEGVILILVLGELILYLVRLLYSIQIYLRLIENYHVRKLWILLWLYFPFIPALMWGLMEKYQPAWKLEDIQKEKDVIISGSQAVVMDEGMTINLEERTAVDFFRKKTLLRDIHMYIQPGHMVLLLGGSGAGKSTFLNAVNGYEKAKAEVILNGNNIYKDYKKMQYEIGFVPQQDLMRMEDTVYNTLMDAAALRLPNDFSGAERKERVNEVMKLFGLLPVKSSLVGKLSGGQKKRLSIAMEFIPNPSLFILDEPDSGLDGVMARELMEQLRIIADHGKIVIVITHTPDRVIDLFDDVIVLAKDANRTGRLAYFGPIEEAKTFFDTDRMERIVLRVNRQEEGGDGRADEFIQKFAEVQNGR